MIDLGDKVKDRLSAYEGIVTSRTMFLNGCARVGVSSGEMKDGKPLESHIFDENQLELLQARHYATDNRVERVAAEELGMIPAGAALPAPTEYVRPEPVRRTGGPQPEVEQRQVPLRRDLER